MVAPWRVVWITGASSGIGLALARLIAGHGAHVAISARSADTLADIAAANPNIHAFPLDVVDAAANQAVVDGIAAKLGPIDLAVFNAGYWQPMSSRTFDPAEIKKSYDINYLGAVNGIAAVLPAMRARKSGHVALVASVAGYNGLPRGIAYGPTKAAMINLAETLKPDLARDHIAVSVINPGFVETPMTAVNEFPMPFIIKADDAAERMYRGLSAKRFEIAFPWQLVTILKVLRILPYRVFFWLIRNRVGSGEKN